MERKSVTYEINAEHEGLCPTQAEFEWLVNAMDVFDLSFGELLPYLNDNRAFEACAYRAPLHWDPEYDWR